MDPPRATGGSLLYCGPPWTAEGQVPHNHLHHGLQGNLLLSHILTPISSCDWKSEITVVHQRKLYRYFSEPVLTFLSSDRCLLCNNKQPCLPQDSTWFLSAASGDTNLTWFTMLSFLHLWDQISAEMTQELCRTGNTNSPLHADGEPRPGSAWFITGTWSETFYIASSSVAQNQSCTILPAVLHKQSFHFFKLYRTGGFCPFSKRELKCWRRVWCRMPDSV